MSRIVIIAAMPGELQPLVRGWQQESRNGVDLWHRSSADGEWVAACAGAGVDRATRAFAEAERVLSRSGKGIDLVISTGWAGALDAKYLPGQVYWVSGVIDVRTGERFPAESPGGLGDSFPRSPKQLLVRCLESSTGQSRFLAQNRDLGHPASGEEEAGPSTPFASLQSLRMTEEKSFWLATSPKVADEAEKRRLASAYNAGLVDMEASAVARAAERRGAAFYCCKGISDGFNDHLPDLNAFISKNGKFQLARFVVFALLRPVYWPSLIRMGENSKRSAQGIAEAILALLDNKK